MKAIKIEELQEQIENKNPIIDVREKSEYQTGHIPGAKNIPLSEIKQRYKEIANGSYIICQSGGRSLKACHYLELQGIEAVNVLGSTSSWNGLLVD